MPISYQEEFNMEYEDFIKIKNPTSKECLSILTETYETQLIVELWNSFPKTLTNDSKFINKALQENSIVIICLPNPTSKQIKKAVLDLPWLVQHLNLTNKKELLAELISQEPEINEWL